MFFYERPRNTRDKPEVVDTVTSIVCVDRPVVCDYILFLDEYATIVNTR